MSDHAAADIHATDLDHAVDIDKHVRVYITVFVALMALTVITVAVSYLDLSTPVAIAVALFIAIIKGSLVACYFMHLISEKKLIYVVLAITVFKFVALMLLPVLTHSNGYWISE
jgi:cytochrome c oxidase subunit 4